MALPRCTICSHTAGVVDGRCACHRDQISPEQCDKITQQNAGR